MTKLEIEQVLDQMVEFAKIRISEKEEFKLIDSLGNKFRDVPEVFAFYGIRKINGDVSERAETKSEEVQDKSEEVQDKSEEVQDKSEEVQDKRIKKSLLYTDEYGNIHDHLGNNFKTVGEMCEHYKINKATFYHRLTKNVNLEMALTAPSLRGKSLADNENKRLTDNKSKDTCSNSAKEDAEKDEILEEVMQDEGITNDIHELYQHLINGE